MTSLDGKVIAITGAASGIGLAASHLLASRGAAISIADIRQEPLEAAVANIKKVVPNVKIHHKAVNVARGDEVSAWLDETITQLGGLHGAANLAGVIGTLGLKRITEVTDDDWDFVMDVNVRGVFNCLRAQLQRMEKDSSIVNAASIAGLKASDMTSQYTTSKHAVIGLTKSAAREVGVRNIRVNCVAPGAIDTPMINEIAARSPSATDLKLCINRTGRPEEVAKLIAFLLSDESTYTTGSVYTIDGGCMA